MPAPESDSSAQGDGYSNLNHLEFHQFSLETQPSETSSRQVPGAEEVQIQNQTSETQESETTDVTRVVFPCVLPASEDSDHTDHSQNPTTKSKDPVSISNASPLQIECCKEKENRTNNVDSYDYSNDIALRGGWHDSESPSSRDTTNKGKDSGSGGGGGKGQTILGPDGSEAGEQNDSKPNDAPIRCPFPLLITAAILGGLLLIGLTLAPFWWMLHGHKLRASRSTSLRRGKGAGSSPAFSQISTGGRTRSRSTSIATGTSNRASIRASTRLSQTGPNATILSSNMNGRQMRVSAGPELGITSSISSGSEEDSNERVSEQQRLITSMTSSSDSSESLYSVGKSDSDFKRVEFGEAVNKV